MNISVVIPAYNMQRFIARSVHSALKSTVPGTEVIVLNDGSTDNTQQVLESFVDEQSPDYDPRVKVYRHANRGKPETVNRGIEIARGEYIAILDADDELPDKSLHVRFDAATCAAGIDLVIGACEVFDEKERLDVWEAPDTDDPLELRQKFYLHPRQSFHLNACLMSKSLIEKTGRFNPKRDRCEDIDYAMRLLSNTTSDAIMRTGRVTYRYRKYRASFNERTRLRWSTLVNRVGVMVDNLNGTERVIGIVAGLSFDTLKMIYEFFISAYPKRISVG